MTGDELRAVIDALGVTQTLFAKMIRVTPRAVNLWVQGDRSVPGPVAAFLEVLAKLSRPERLMFIDDARRK